MGRHVLLVACLILITACGADYDSYDASDVYAASDADEEIRQNVYDEYGADSDGTGADASRVDAYEVRDEGDYYCRDDCSGHEAGFEWAQENDVTDTSECGGSSESFVEGCEAFAEARQELADSEAQEAAEDAVLEAAESGDDYEGSEW